MNLTWIELAWLACHASCACPALYGTQIYIRCGYACVRVKEKNVDCAQVNCSCVSCMSCMRCSAASGWHGGIESAVALSSRRQEGGEGVALWFGQCSRLYSLRARASWSEVSLRHTYIRLPIQASGEAAESKGRVCELSRVVHWLWMAVYSHYATASLDNSPSNNIVVGLAARYSMFLKVTWAAHRCIYFSVCKSTGKE